LFTSLP